MGKNILYSSRGLLEVGESFNYKNFNLEKYYFDFPVERGEKYVILSSGFARNNFVNGDSKKLKGFFDLHLNRTNSELLDEVFFELKKDYDDEFLNFDSTAIIFEVDKNVLKKI